MIESIEFHNFKILRDCELPLGSCNILVGPNGSGKSTVLQALLAVRDSKSVDYSRVVSIGDKGAAEPQWVEVKLSEGDPDRGVSHVARWRHSAPGSRRDHAAKNPVGLVEQARAELLAKTIASIRVYSFDARAIAKPAIVQPKIELGEDGSQLASVLDDLRDTNPEKFREINDAVGRWMPEFSAILFDKPTQGHKSIVLESRDGKYRIPAASVSQGSLQALALLTLAYLPEPPMLIGLEEPDRGIHPRLLRHVADAVHRLTHPKDYGENRKPIQIVATTHSPYFLDLFRDHPEEIVIANKIGHNVRFERVSERPDIHEILAGAPLGEIWYSGILGGVPAEP